MRDVFIAVMGPRAVAILRSGASPGWRMGVTFVPWTYFIPSSALCGWTLKNRRLLTYRALINNVHMYRGRL